MPHSTLLTLAYFPPVSWCAAAWNGEKIVVEAHENYQKGSLRNRCFIAGSNGAQRLSIPLEQGKNNQMPIREVRIAYNEPWQRQHWRSIRTAYGNAPFFEHYAADLVPFFEKKYTFLFDYNFDLLTFILQKKLGWKGIITLSESYSPPQNWPQGEDYREVISSKPSGWPIWFQPARYPQVFEEKNGFLFNLSLLDLLFCCGKQSSEVLLKSFKI